VAEAAAQVAQGAGPPVTPKKKEKDKAWEGVFIPTEKIQAVIKETLAEYDSARYKMYLQTCVRCGLCSDACHYYIGNNRDPHFSPAMKLKQTLYEMVNRDGAVDLEFMKQAAEIVHTECNCCRRCSMYCPFGIDIQWMIGIVRRTIAKLGLTPEHLIDTVRCHETSANQMCVSDEDYEDTLIWMEEESRAEVTNVTIPIDKVGAEYMYTLDAREPKFYPQDVGQAAIIFSVAGIDWTLPRGKGWDPTNLAMFSGHIDIAKKTVKAMYDAALRLKVKTIVVTECGHAYKAVRFEGPYWLGLPNGQPPVNVIHTVQLLYELVRDGKIQIAKKFTEPCTYQDPCNVARNGGLLEEPRYLINRMCTDFREMQPNREHNFCCSAGGGAINCGPAWKSKRMAGGSVKAEQIRRTGAKYVIVPCHNCYDQLNDLSAKYNLGTKAIFFKELLVDHGLMHIPDELRPKKE